MGRKTGALWPPLALAILFLGGCSSLDLRSTWLDHDLVLNGNVKDWPGGVNPLYGEKISMGASNNADSLFIALVVKDSAGGVYSNFSRTIAVKGLTTWIDPRGEDAWSFGIRLMGMEDPGFERPPLERSSDSGEAQALPPSMDLAANLLEIITEKGVVIKTSGQALRPFGFEAKATYTGDSFIYVMKIPLKAIPNSPFPAALATSKSVGIDFESGPLKLHKPGYGAAASSAVSMLSGGVSNAGNGSGLGSGGGGANEDPDQLSYWISVDLAAKP